MRLTEGTDWLEMDSAHSSLTTQARLLILAAFAPLYLFFMVNWWRGWFRFASPRLNCLFMTFVFASPLMALWIAWTLKSRVFRLIVSALLIVVSLGSGALLLGSVLTLIVWVPNVILSDVDYSFERLRQERVANELFAVYRTNGGATSGFGIVVRREHEILPGLFKVCEVCSCNEAEDVRLTRVDTQTIHCECVP